MAYEAYRRDFLIRASKQRGMIYHHLGWLLRPPKYFEDEEGNPSPSIVSWPSPEQRSELPI